MPRARASPGVPSYSSRRSRFVTNLFPLSLHRSTPRLVVQRIINRWFYTKSTVVYTVSKPTKPGNVRSQSWREGDGPPRLTSRVRRRRAHLLIQLEPLAFLLRQLLVAAGEGELLASEALLPLGLLSCRRRWGGVGRGQWIARRGKKKVIFSVRDATIGGTGGSGKRRVAHLGRLARRLLLLFLPLWAAKISIWVGGLFSRFCAFPLLRIPWPNSTPCCGEKREKKRKRVRQMAIGRG